MVYCNNDVMVKNQNITEPERFFEQALSVFTQIVTDSAESIDYYYKISDYTIQLKFATSNLIPLLTPALSHLAIKPVIKPDLQICLWDSESTQSQMVRPAWSFEQITERGEIIGFNDERFHTSFLRPGNRLNMLDKSKNLGLLWTKSALNLPYWDRGAPLKELLSNWIIKKNIQLVHGGAIGLPEGAVLIAGRSGAGKSTLCLNCFNSDLYYASDDYVLIQADPQPTLFSLYSSGKKNSDDIERFPHLLPFISNKNKLSYEKALYFLNSAFPEKIIKQCPLFAVLVPRIISEKNSYLEHITKLQALSALVPSTILQIPGVDANSCKIIQKTVMSVPCFEIKVGSDLSQAHDVIRDLIMKGCEHE